MKPWWENGTADPTDAPAMIRAVAFVNIPGDGYGDCKIDRIQARLSQAQPKKRAPG